MKRGKQFLTSQYYKLADVHALNTYLKELPESNMPKEMIEEVSELIARHKSYDKLEDYVPNSDKYNQIAEKNRLYEEAQTRLKELGYTKEAVIDDTYADLSNFTKHTITYKTTKTHTDWYWSEEAQDEIGEDYQVEVEVIQHFYTNSYCEYNAVNPMDYIRPYTREKGYGDPEDLIAEQLRQYKYVLSELQALEFCNDQGFSIEHFKSVFDIKKLSYYGTFRATSVKDDIGKEYHTWDIKKLIEEVQVAKKKKYIREDKYVEYPYTDYINFLENYLGKTHFEEPKS